MSRRYIAGYYLSVLDHYELFTDYHKTTKGYEAHGTAVRIPEGGRDAERPRTSSTFRPGARHNRFSTSSTDAGACSATLNGTVMASYGGMPFADVASSVEMLGRHVLPRTEGLGEQVRVHEVGSVQRDASIGLSVATRTHLLHLALGITLILILPALSWWRGTGGLAFTMFSRSGSYRLRVVTTDAGGNEQRVPPTAVAARAGGSIGDLLAGSEEWRFAPFGPLLHRRIDQIATLSCTARPGSARARVIIEERDTLDAPASVFPKRP